eukprot:Nitzschia sp. Nitz4//scaffold82_size85912//50608//51837//NITZ4_005145-RA/size85912-processed-gene-0.120-mRNA-1//-1//CDS//3329558847//1768//frame0
MASENTPLVFGTFSNKGVRGRSKRRGSKKPPVNAAEIDVVRSLSDEPDAMIDMEELYYDDLNKEEEYERRHRDHLNGNYFFDLLDNLPIKEALEGLQAGSMQMVSIDRPIGINAKETQTRVNPSIDSLYKKLKASEEESELLRHRLQEVVSLHAEENARYVEIIQELEEKLNILSEASRLEDDGIQHKTDQDVKRLQNTVTSLQKQLAGMQAQKQGLEASFRDKETQFDEYVSNTSSRISELEQKCTAAERKARDEQTKATRAKLELLEAKQQIELHKQKNKALELSEARVQMLLAAERKRADTIGGLNERMQSTMKKLSKKALGNESQGQVDEMKKELDKRDARIKMIKKILKGKTVSSTTMGPEEQPGNTVNPKKPDAIPSEDQLAHHKVDSSVTSLVQEPSIAWHE